jgi:hypothetical protein
MATRSRIGIQNEDGTIRSVYCHFDGYTDYVGSILRGNYSSSERINALLDQGDMSSLGYHIDDCEFYARDRGEKLEDNAAMVHENRREFLKYGEQYNYLYCKDGVWRVCETGSTFRRFD